MTYRLRISNRAKKDLQSLDNTTRKRIAKKLKFFIEQEDPLKFAKKLSDNKDGNFRWRIGHYRAIFDLEDRVIKLLRIQHRKDIYRK